MAVKVGSPTTEEDESVIVFVDDESTILAVFPQPLDLAVGMKNAISEGKLGAGLVDEILEWNGEGSDGGIGLEFERAGCPILLSSADGGVVIVRDV